MSCSKFQCHVLMLSDALCVKNFGAWLVLPPLSCWDVWRTRSTTSLPRLGLGKLIKPMGFMDVHGTSAQGYGWPDLPMAAAHRLWDFETENGHEKWFFFPNFGQWFALEPAMPGQVPHRVTESVGAPKSPCHPCDLEISWDSGPLKFPPAPKTSNETSVIRAFHIHSNCLIAIINSRGIFGVDTGNVLQCTASPRFQQLFEELTSQSQLQRCPGCTMGLFS